jgi:hypothetical protein
MIEELETTKRELYTLSLEKADLQRQKASAADPSKALCDAEKDQYLSRITQLEEKLAASNKELAQTLIQHNPTAIGGSSKDAEATTMEALSRHIDSLQSEQK